MIFSADLVDTNSETLFCELGYNHNSSCLMIICNNGLVEWFSLVYLDDLFFIAQNATFNMI